MPELELFQAALGLVAPWRVVRSDFESSERGERFGVVTDVDLQAGQLDLEIDFPRGARFACPGLRQTGFGVRHRGQDLASSQLLGSDSMPTPKSQVSGMAKSLDGMVNDFRNRPLDAGPYTYVWVDALTQRCREGGRVVNVCTAIATGVNADG